MNHEDKLIRDICYTSSFPRGHRTGQVLFNYLPTGARNAVAGTMIDPFHKRLTTEELYQWLNDHVIFDGDRIIAVFNNNHFIWEES